MLFITCILLAYGIQASMSTTYVDDVFGGVTVSTVTCLGCETVRYYINVLTIYTVTLLGLMDGYFSILFVFSAQK